MTGRAPFTLTALVIVAAVAACGDGGGGDGTGTEPQATFTAPSFTAGPSERQSVSLALRTNGAAASFQVDMLSPPDVIPEIDGVVADGRAAGLSNAIVQNLEPGHARLLLFDPGGEEVIPAGQGSVLVLSFRIAETAPAGTAPIALEQGIVVDAEAREFAVTLEPGEVTIVR